MAKLSTECMMPRRRAEVNVNKYWSTKYKIPTGITPCHVLGIYQEAGDDEAYPVAICELDDGRVMLASPDDVRFVDTVKGVIM